MRIGPGLSLRLRDLAGIDRVRAVDWSDHGGLLGGRIGNLASNFSFAADKGYTLVSLTKSEDTLTTTLIQRRRPEACAVRLA